MRFVFAGVPLVLTAIILSLGWYYFDTTITGPQVVEFWSGVTTAAALVWLISGYFQQSAELRLQRQELQLQREELKKSNVELAAQAKALNVQAEAIGIQAELARQSAVMNARKEFVVDLSFKTVKLIRRLQPLYLTIHNDKSGIEKQASLYFGDNSQLLWDRFERGDIRAFFSPAANVFRKMASLKKQRISHVAFENSFPEKVVEFFSEFLVIAGKYGELIDSLQAHRYDQEPFTDLGYAAWNLVQLLQHPDDHGSHSNSAQEREMVSGPEWIKRSNRYGHEAGLRYIFEGDTTVDFAAIIDMAERPLNRAGDLIEDRSCLH